MVLIAFFIIIFIVILFGAFPFICRKLSAILRHDSITVKVLNSEDEHLAEIEGSSSKEHENTIAPKKANSPEEELRYAASLVVHYSSYANTSSLRWKLGVDDQRAEAILSDLERLGIVGPKNPLNSFADRPVLVKDLNRLEDILARHELLVKAKSSL